MSLSKNAIWRLCHTYVNKQTGNLYLAPQYLDRSRYNGDGSRKPDSQLRYEFVRDGKVQLDLPLPKDGTIGD